jgi:hypothetical protein
LEEHQIEYSMGEAEQFSYFFCRVVQPWMTSEDNEEN